MKLIFYTKLFFKFDTLHATFKKEIIGGLTTFLSMVYILSVEPSMLSAAPSITNIHEHMRSGGIFLATAIVAALSTMFMGLSSNMPAGMAPSMGLNAVFTFNVASANNGSLGYEGALIAVMVSSIIFLIISLTKLRVIIVKAIPRGIKLAIGAGIGFFIAYLGFANIGFVAMAPSGVPAAALGHFRADWPIILVGLFVLILIFFLHFKKVPGAIAIAIVVGLIISLIIGNTSNSAYAAAHFAKWHGWSYAQFGDFTLNLKDTYQQFANPNIWSNPTLYISMFVFIFVCFFDATGTLNSMCYQIQEQSGITYELNQKALRSDALGSLISGFLGVSNATTFVESTTGVAQGARTGFSSLITALMFLISIVLFPIFNLVTPAICGSALIFVGSLMVLQIKEVDWHVPEICIASFLMILVMIITYTITNGIAIGLIAYAIISIICNKRKQVHAMIYILDVLFIAYFISCAFTTT